MEASSRAIVLADVQGKDRPDEEPGVATCPPAGIRLSNRRRFACASCTAAAIGQARKGSSAEAGGSLAGPCSFVFRIELTNRSARTPKGYLCGRPLTAAGTDPSNRAGITEPDIPVEPRRQIDRDSKAGFRAYGSRLGEGSKRGSVNFRSRRGTGTSDSTRLRTEALKQGDLRRNHGQ